MTDTVERLIKNSQALHPRKVATLRRARKGKPFAQKRKEATKYEESLLSDSRFFDPNSQDQNTEPEEEPENYEVH